MTVEIEAMLWKKAKTGDVLIVEGTSFISKFIRVVTGQNASHVALLFWQDQRLMVAEMIEGVGYRVIDPGEWLKINKENIVYYGEAPNVVRSNRKAVESVIHGSENEDYSYLSLISVWWAQLWKTKTKHKLVCSTFVQKAWNAAGFVFKHTADPGDFMRLCKSVQALGINRETQL